MAEEKSKKDVTCDNCDQTSSCSQEEIEAYTQERLGSRLSLIKHRLGCRIIPEWIERWALGE